MDTPSSASNAKAKKSKKPLIAGIVVAVVIVAGIGFWTWHNTPGFCGVCHTPMSTYVDTFEAQPGTPAVDKWGNNVSDRQFDACRHAQAGRRGVPVRATFPPLASRSARLRKPSRATTITRSQKHRSPS